MDHGQVTMDAQSYPITELVGEGCELVQTLWSDVVGVELVDFVEVVAELADLPITVADEQRPLA
jgi:hypothetical protein